MLASPMSVAESLSHVCPLWLLQNNAEAIMFFVGALIVCCLGYIMYKRRFDQLRQPQIVDNAFMVRPSASSNLPLAVVEVRIVHVPLRRESRLTLLESARAVKVS